MIGAPGLTAALALFALAICGFGTTTRAEYDEDRSNEPDLKNLAVLVISWPCVYVEPSTFAVNCSRKTLFAVVLALANPESKDSQVGPPSVNLADPGSAPNGPAVPVDEYVAEPCRRRTAGRRGSRR